MGVKNGKRIVQGLERKIKKLVNFFEILRGKSEKNI